MSSIVAQGTSNGSFRSERLLNPVDVRLHDLLAGLVSALDLAQERPAGFSLRSCALSLRLASELRLAPSQCTAVYFLSLLGNMGGMTYVTPMSSLLNPSDEPATEILRLLECMFETERSRSTDEPDLLVRLVQLAREFESVRSASNVNTALEVIESRPHTHNDRQVTSVIRAIASDASFWSQFSANVTDSLQELAVIDAMSQSADEQQLNGIARAFALTIDARSRWTMGHSHRVAEIVDGTASELGCDIDVRRDLRVAALLHDVGKLAIAPSLLDSIARPTREEFAAYRKHAEYTFTILASVNGCEQLARAAGGHHERLDGRGYPNGLMGQQIPWSARILAVADSFEALSSRRPFRPAMSFEQVRDILIDDIDTGVDAICLAALLRWHDRSSFEQRLDQQYHDLDRLCDDPLFTLQW